ncbi:hypothetical protein CTAYLR_009969 [Chrysophaeum taylorii]|uniref:Calponin-homology (CH) domain-containing protein n=1 Tax=Chrysophaeum taylorii TaxID=2483200 RepID=A0AAD7U7T4_9STRA|nr:hypothetical protein CTAYLR_009969 [Chrysophaeum taylorii]
MFTTIDEVAKLTPGDIKALDRTELTSLLAQWERSLSDEQTAAVISRIDEWEEEDDDDGFVLDPRPPQSPGRSRRNSVTDTVWVREEDDDSPTVSTTITESVRYEDDTDNDSTLSRGEFSNAPQRFNASVDNLDHECQAKRRAKAADDASEFARGLKWVCLVVGIDAPVDVEARPEESFGEHLKDGVLLCQLLNKIKPGTVTRVSKGALAFHQMSNITAFLRGCQAVGVKKRDCFDTVDLQQLRDLSKVYETLLMLSTMAERHRLFPGPFLYSAKREERRRRRSSEKLVATMPSISSEKLVATRPSISSDTTPNDTSLDTFITTLGLEKYKDQLSQVADDTSDLTEMTEDDYAAFVRNAAMPALKARRFKKALIDLGANLQP